MSEPKLTFGMLWYSPDKEKPLEERIQEAIRYYSNKYSQEATLVALNPKTLEGGEAPEIDGLDIQQSIAVQVDHFWIGQFEGEVKA